MRSACNGLCGVWTILTHPEKDARVGSNCGGETINSFLVGQLALKKGKTKTSVLPVLKGIFGGITAIDT